MEKVAVGFIGAGNIAQAHLNKIHQNKAAEIIAICDIDKKTAQQQAMIYKAKAFTDVEEMLDKMAMDAVFICVPPFARGNLEEQVVAKGIHIFVEKPLGLDVKEARKKAVAIEQSGVINASGYCLRYLDTVQGARNYLQGKKIAMVRGHYLSGFVKTPWYRIKAKSGGQLVEQSTHVLDLMSYLAGDIMKVNADAGLLVMDDVKNIDIPDVTSVNILFATGAVGHLDSTFIQPDHRMGVECLGRGFRVEITATELIIVDHEGKKSYQMEVDFLEEQDKAFIKAVQTKNQQLIHASYAEGVETLAVSLAANKSYETSLPVDL